MNNWIEIMGAVIGSSFLTQVGNFLVQRKKVESNARLKDAKRSDELNMQMWMEINKEQRDWREVMRKEIDRLQEKYNALSAENANLLMQVAELKAYNQDLKRDNDQLQARVIELKQDNDQLEARVKELERDLHKRDEAVTQPEPEVA